MKKYSNRREAGAVLAQALYRYQQQDDVIILALPRGGVPVAYEVALSLHAPLDVFIVRKLGVPGYHELAMGAMAEDGQIIFNKEIIHEYSVKQDEIDAVAAQEYEELQRRAKKYRMSRAFPELKNMTVIIVDDGIATGASMAAAVQAIRSHHPAKIVVAVPVADRSLSGMFHTLAEEFVCPHLVDQLRAVGEWYDDFEQTEDDEVLLLLSQAQDRH
jgi:putative phosphoribosyl transferase